MAGRKGKGTWNEAVGEGMNKHGEAKLSRLLLLASSTIRIIHHKATVRVAKC